MESMSELLMKRIGTGEKLRKQDNLSSNKDSLTTPTSIFKCDICKDVKVVFFKDEEGIERTRNCECLENELKENRYRKLKEFSEMPLHLKELRLKDFRVDIYDNQENRILAEKAKKIAIAYIKQYKAMQGKNTGLYFYSDCKGSGKTRLAIGIGNALMDYENEHVKFITTAKLLQEIKSTFNDFKGFTSTQYLDAIKDVNVLILDDIGTERLTDWVNETFYEIINERLLNNKITIYTSNCRADELKHDSRITSRILGSTFAVKCPEEDIRVKLKERDNVDIERILLGGDIV